MEQDSLAEFWCLPSLPLGLSSLILPLHPPFVTFLVPRNSKEGEEFGGVQEPWKFSPKGLPLETNGFEDLELRGGPG